MEDLEPPSYGGISCVFSGCDNSTSFCNHTCYSVAFPIPLPPPLPSSPPPPPPSSQNHVAPFLIATVCILGISFLLLSTCTIILRYRFTNRRRVVSPENPHDDDAAVHGGFSAMDHPIWHITTVGLQQSVIDSITAFKYKKIDGFFVDESDSSCSVCLTEFEEGDDLRLLPKCSHAFHLSCIDTWLRSHKNCPLCRAPVVNEIEDGNSGVGQLSLSNLGAGEEVQRMNFDDNSGGEGSSRRLRLRGDDLGELPVLEGIRIAEILKKNRELRILSDLGDTYRFRGVGEVFEPVRRSISFNAIAASAMRGATVGNEGCSRDGSSNKGCSRDGSSNEGCSRGGSSGVILQDKKIDLEKGGNKRGSSMSGLLTKSSSNGCSLQKGPVSMKRSMSSSSRFFSFRKTKSQASVLPL